jgi:hypothetical protein
MYFLILSSYFYYPFLIDLLLNKIITVEMIYPFIFMKHNLVKENVDKILEYFRKEGDNNLYFLKAYITLFGYLSSQLRSWVLRKGFCTMIRNSILFCLHELFVLIIIN